jgi:hypothetical protein
MACRNWLENLVVIVDGGFGIRKIVRVLEPNPERLGAAVCPLVTEHPDY